MSSPNESTIANILYYFQHDLPQQVAKFTTESLKRSPRNPQLLFWDACAKGFSGSRKEAIKDLQQIQSSDKQIAFATRNAISHFNSEKCHRTGEENGRFEIELNCYDSDGAILAAAFHLFASKNATEAMRIIDECDVRSILPVREGRMTGGFCVDALRASGAMAQKITVKKELVHNITLLSDSSLFCIMVLVQILFEKGEIDHSLDLTNRAIAMDESFLPAYLEKIKILLSAGKYEQAREISQRAISLCKDGDNYEALRIHLFVELLMDGVCKATLGKLDDFVRRAASIKSLNPKFCFESAQLFARLSDQSTNLLNLTKKLIEYACDKDLNNSPYRVELAYHFRLLGKYDKALECLQQTLESDESNFDSMLGIVMCHLELDDVQQAVEQLEFLSVFHEEQSPELIAIRALISMKKDEEVGTNMKNIQSAIRDIIVQRHTTKRKSIILEYIGVDPRFLLEIAQELLKLGNAASIRSKMTPLSSSGKNAIHLLVVELLQNVTSKYPGGVRAWILLAKAMVDLQRYDSAMDILESCKKINPKSSLILLMSAEVLALSQSYESAKSSLEQAMSLDFAVASHPMYRFIQGKILLHEGAVEDARVALEDVISSASRNRSENEKDFLGIKERLECYVLFASTLNQTAAEEVLMEAADELKGTQMEIEALIECSRVAVKNGNFDRAIKILDNVKEPSMIVPAQLELGDIYLQLSNQQGYIKCYEKIYNISKTIDSIVLLGDAYITIESPLEASEFYEKAAAQDPESEVIAIRLGKSLGMIGDDAQTIDYFENVLRNYPWHESVRFELITLYRSLNEHGKAINLIKKTLHDTSADSNGDVDQLSYRLSLLTSLAELYKLTEANKEMNETLLEAKEVCQSIMDSKNADSYSDLCKQNDPREKLARIYSMLAEISAQKGDFSEAETLLHEVLEVQSDEKTILRLGDLCLKQGKYEECEEIAKRLLSISPESEASLKFHGDLMVAQSKIADAYYTFRKLLLLYPTNFAYMSTFLKILYRENVMKESSNWIHAAEAKCEDAFLNPGFQYAKGLSLLYQSKPLESLTCFNLARACNVWGEKALKIMVEIYLQQAIIFKESRNGSLSAKVQQYCSIAENLLDEFQSVSVDQSMTKVLKGNLALIRGDNEVALKEFREVLVNNKEYVPALLGHAKTLMVTDASSSKARNVAKQIVRIKYDEKFAEEFEESYLLLAELYIARENEDLAIELCRRALNFNKSCRKAFEIIGRVMEKRGSFLEAADNYDMSWKMSQKLKPGYKSAMLLYRCKRTVKAVETCQELLIKFGSCEELRELMFKHCVRNIRP